jgi:hypothetical protein
MCPIKKNPIARHSPPLFKDCEDGPARKPPQALSRVIFIAEIATLGIVAISKARSQTTIGAAIFATPSSSASATIPLPKTKANWSMDDVKPLKIATAKPFHTGAGASTYALPDVGEGLLPA